MHLLILTQVRQGHDITGVRGVARLVGDPDLHTVDLDTCHHVGQRRHRLVIPLTEIVGEEEVAVLLIVGHIEFEGRGLGTAFRRDALR